MHSVDRNETRTESVLDDLDDSVRITHPSDSRDPKPLDPEHGLHHACEQ